MSLSARQIAEILSGTKSDLRHRWGEVVSVQNDGTCTVTIAGADEPIAGIRYAAAVCPRPGAGVLLEVSGSDVFAVDTIAPVGPAFCHVRRPTDQSIGNGSPTQVTFGSPPDVISDAWGMISGNSIVIRVNGIYLITFQYAFEGHATGWREGAILKNGNVWARDRRTSIGAGAPTYGTVTHVERMAVGDVVTVSVHQTSGGPLALVGGAADRSRVAVTYLGAG